MWIIESIRLHMYIIRRSLLWFASFPNQQATEDSEYRRTYCHPNRNSDHITPVLYDLHWLPVAQRIKFKVLLFVFKCQNNMAPSYLQDLVKPQQQARTLRSSDQHLLEVPFTRNVSFSDICFGVAGPRLCNSLP